MEGKRNRGEVTAELSEKVWARLCRENALVASEVWVDDASRVDFVAYRPHRPRDRSSNHATAAELESGTFHVRRGQVVYGRFHERPRQDVRGR